MGLLLGAIAVIPVRHPIQRRTNDLFNLIPKFDHEANNDLILIVLFVSSSRAQGFNKSVNKDSLLQIIAKNIPEEIRDEMLKEYNSRSGQEKESFLYMLSVFYMTKDHKKELISNIDSNYDKVDRLKTEYAKLVPAKYAVRIEFLPGNPLVNTKESIDLRITGTENERYYLDQEWNMPYNSARLSQSCVHIIF